MNDDRPQPSTGTHQVQASLTQQWLFNLHALVVTLIVEPALVEEAAKPMLHALMKSGVARMEALESMKKEKKDEQQQ